MRIPHRLGVFLKGVGMGAADVVPGVSGGTIAFITGIYDELLDSIRSINPNALKILFKDGVGACWQHINGTFLVTLLAGIFTSVLTLSHAITYLLAAYPLMLWSFFFGLVIASAVHIARELNLKAISNWVLIIAGAVLAFWITSHKPVHVEPDLLTIFVGGAIAICAMILPGISGSFILLMLGLYSHILQAIKGLDLMVIAVFGAGCATGLLSFVHLLSWMLKHYRSQSIAVLTGFLIGSLNALWPWKHVLETYVSSKGAVKPLVQQNVLPGQFAAVSGQDPQLIMCLLLAAGGVVLVLALEWLTDSE
ncbi:Uncharacterised protein [BD1-7 clade bacterium]|uniref:DUF368 domain-containing protein n=1 Tax=BD1-7 clade bacterium TaxID=2029982 RepID=A0A5S9PCW3_9GAMM|nr:Uncharacterised protein [BD1-7 clade bacterium]CAA0102285.1 Uncharacterised protein [BD1-7 clade bacterium]